jgi:serine/threonine protein phosphatase 1
MHWLGKIIGKKSTEPRLRTGRRVFAIGDIHGRLDLLNVLLKQIANHAARHPVPDNGLIFLGDYIDRGPDSRGVIERLSALQQVFPGWDLHFLRGNHDNAALEFIENPGRYTAWRSHGAAQTLLSYGVIPPRFEKRRQFEQARDDFVRAIPRAHVKFLDQLKYFHVEDDYLFVHAGIRPGIALADQLPEDLLWIREDFLLHRRRFEKMIVHGHTPAPSPIVLSNRICVDTGAHATGHLTALILDSESRGFLVTGKAMERVAQRNNLASPRLRREVANN